MTTLDRPGAETGRRTRRAFPPAGERAKLTIAVGGLLLVACAATVVLVYVIVGGGLTVSIGTAFRKGVDPLPEPISSSPPGGRAITKTLQQIASETALNRLLTSSVIVLAVVALVGIVLAWWLAGRVLRPIGEIAATARSLSGTDLSGRIRLDAPPGQLKDLADTLDQLLDRIDVLVSSQKRFVANAAHELRTHVSVQRSAAEVGLADADAERVERIRAKLIENADENERLIEGLLLLAVTDRGLTRNAPIPLATVVDEVCADLAAEADAASVTVMTEGISSTITGDATLMAHLVRNLVANAVRYNRPGGTVVVRVTADGLVVTNTGAEIDPTLVDGLFEPFRRLHPRQHRPGEGAGLGLAIVASIAHAHGGTVGAEPNPGGGLVVQARLPGLG